MLRINSIGKNDSSDDDLKLDDNELTQVIKKESRQFYINFDGEIDDVEYYRSVFKILREATENDEVILVINSPGGYVNTAIQLHNYLINTKAKTKAEVYAAYSAASVLMLSCDEIEMKEFSSIMVHSIAYGAVGKIDEIKEHTKFIEKLNNDINSRLYQTFLTDAEMINIMSNKDYWFAKEEVLRRLKNWIPIRQRTVTEKKKGKKVKKDK